LRQHSQPRSARSPRACGPRDDSEDQGVVIARRTEGPTWQSRSCLSPFTRHSALGTVPSRHCEEARGRRGNPAVAFRLSLGTRHSALRTCELIGSSER
jgi:hypothetical protein